MKRQIWYMLILSAAFLLTSCVRLEVATPDKPININMSHDPNYQGNESKKGKMPSFMFSLLIVLFPLALVGLKTLSSYFLVKGYDAEHWLEFICHPFIALLLACLLAIYGLGLRYGMNREKVMEICSAAIQPAGIILLITGAGGVFKQVLVNSGVGPVLGNALMNTGLPIALACFVLAAAVRIIQGSATVACFNDYWTNIACDQ